MNYKPQLKIWSVERAQNDLSNNHINFEDLEKRAQAYYDIAYSPEQDWLTLRNRMAEIADTPNIELLRLQEFHEYLGGVIEQRDVKENRAAIQAANKFKRVDPVGAA